MSCGGRERVKGELWDATVIDGWFTCRHSCYLKSLFFRSFRRLSSLFSHVQCTLSWLLLSGLFLPTRGSVSVPYRLASIYWVCTQCAVKYPLYSWTILLFISATVTLYQWRTHSRGWSLQNWIVWTFLGITWKHRPIHPELLQETLTQYICCDGWYMTSQLNYQKMIRWWLLIFHECFY